MKEEFAKLVILIIQCILAVIFNLIVFFMYKTCYDKEVDVHAQVNSTLNGTCIVFFEISEPVKEFLYWSYMPQFSDKMMMMLGIPVFKLYQDPFGILYNLFVYWQLTNRQEYLIGNLTFCGDPVQEEIKNIPMLLNEARTMHFNIAVATLAVCIFNNVSNLFGWFRRCYESYQERKAARPPPPPTSDKGKKKRVISTPADTASNVEPSTAPAATAASPPAPAAKGATPPAPAASPPAPAAKGATPPAPAAKGATPPAPAAKAATPPAPAAPAAPTPTPPPATPNKK